MSKELFSQKLQKLKAELHKTKLLIVSKNRSLDEIKTYYDLGHRDFGENRVQELFDKAQALKDTCPDIRWHMIGHLQSNKIKLLFEVFGLYAIHSVDDEVLVKKLLSMEDKLPHELLVFLQVNTSHELEKSGFEEFSDILDSARLVLSAKKLKLFGLMTMGTIRTDDFEAEARRCFRELNLLKSKLESDLKVKLQTSMGMSQDYHLAAQEQSDWVRLGTMMFSNNPT